MENFNIDLNITDTESYAWNSTMNVDERLPPASATSIIGLSLLFFIIGAIGITGNLLVIFAILGDQRMRNSVTNLLIMNLAVSDLIIMIACIPDIIQFIENRGWRLGLSMCKALRFTEVFALYASVMTLVSVCLESSRRTLDVSRNFPGGSLRQLVISRQLDDTLQASTKRNFGILGVIFPKGR
ncbi:neuropeptide receptor 15-like [Stegodyphus dumicola]|uniref:neuropeptide receptor 15-like n=1 Tax=Stegodyphus dumicola TaxID=202533 RepID=UPI0015AC46F3|nr:neuropeptide receptor 15-like [Stegodyphus dumicola]